MTVLMNGHKQGRLDQLTAREGAVTTALFPVTSPLRPLGMAWGE